MNTQWHFQKNGQTVGPLSSAKFKQLAQQGEIQPETLVWKEGLEKWVPARKVQGLLSESTTKAHGQSMPAKHMKPVAETNRPILKSPSRAVVITLCVAPTVVALLFGVMLLSRWGNEEAQVENPDTSTVLTDDNTRESSEPATSIKMNPAIAAEFAVTKKFLQEQEAKYDKAIDALDQDIKASGEAIRLTKKQIETQKAAIELKVKEVRDLAAQGNAESQFSLGVMYAKGTGVRRNDVEAVKWFRKSAEQGYASAQRSMGIMYGTGKGVSQNFAEAAKWYHKAAEQGNADAQNNLGRCYIIGEGVEKSDVEAAKWFRKSAEQGNSFAQFSLGLCYRDGRGVGKNTEEAAKWFRKAAEQGNSSAQHNLGVCYQNGEGVKKNLQEAAKWLQMAKAQTANRSPSANSTEGITASPTQSAQTLASRQGAANLDVWNKIREIETEFKQRKFKRVSDRFRSIAVDYAKVDLAGIDKKLQKHFRNCVSLNREAANILAELEVTIALPENRSRVAEIKDSYRSKFKKMDGKLKALKINEIFLAPFLTKKYGQTFNDRF